MSGPTTIASTPALRAYADWVRPKVLRVDPDAYSTAVRSFLDAAPNDFGHAGITDRGTAIEQDTEDVEAHNRKAEDFADQLEAWDEEFGLNPRDGVFNIRMTPEEWQELQDRWATLGRNEDLLESAEDIQAQQYADDLLTVLDDDDLGPEERRAAVEQILDDFEAAGLHDDPSAQDTFVTGVGADGINTLYSQARFAESSGSGPWIGILRAMSEHVADTANRMPPDELLGFMEGMAGDVLYANARLTPWDDAATTTAVDFLWGDSDWPIIMATWPNSVADALDAGEYGEGLPTSWRAAAAGLLADNPTVAYEFLLLDDDHDRLKHLVYDIHGPLAGAAIEAAMIQHPGDLYDASVNGGQGSLAFQEAFARSEDAFAWLINHHETTDDGFFNVGLDSMNDASRVALANVGGMFLDDLAFIHQNEAGGGGKGAFAGISTDDLTLFYDELFDSETAQQVAATQLGAYTAVVWNDAVIEVTGEGLGLQELSGATSQIDDLSNLFTRALVEDGASDAERASFWVGVGKSTTQLLTGLGIAASPLTGGASTVAGAGAGWTISTLADQVPIPDFDARAHSVGERQQASQTAIQVLLAYPEQLDQNFTDGSPPFSLDPDVHEVLTGDQVWEDLGSSDESIRLAAITQLNEIIADNNVFRDALNDLTGELRWADENG